jgi:transposase
VASRSRAIRCSPTSSKTSWAVHGPARARTGAVLRREEPSASAQSHPAGSAAEEGARGHHDARLQATRTTTLFAALNVLNGQVIAQCQPRHRHTEWLKFLRQIDSETPKDKALHLICDNYATHKHPVVQRWLSKHPRVNMHFTPTSASWLNMVERFFRDITTERLRRGVFTSVAELTLAIDGYIAHHNKDPKPFIWTKSARDILQKVIRANSRLSSK